MIFFINNIMKVNDQFKGIIWALVGAVAMSNVYIFSKAALSELHLFQFGFYWFGFGLIWNIIYSASTKKFAAVKSFTKSTYISIGIIGLLEIISTSLFFLAINTADSPSVISFLADANPLFVAVLGVVFLKERFNKIEALGMLLVLSGALIISYNSPGEQNSILIPGSQYILLSVFIYAIATIYAKSKIKIISPAILSINRVLLLFVFVCILLITDDQSLHISSFAFINLIIGSLLGPFLTGLANYSSLQYLGASKSAIIRSSRSLFVLIGAYIYFHTLPETHQLIGGFFTITGVILISIAKQISIFHKKKK